MTRSPRRFGSQAAFDAIKPDPDKVGGIGEAPFIRLPDPSTLFAARAKRLLDLAPGNPLEPYLRFLSAIAAAQHAAPAITPASRPSRELLCDDAGFAEIQDWIITNISLSNAPREARDARDRLTRHTPQARLSLAVDVFDATYDPGRLAEAIYAAAAVQLYLTRAASALDAKNLQPHLDNTCPCCGGAPLASLIVSWTQANKARYLSCSLCGTLWNYVRIKCVSCGSTDGISYLSIDGGAQDVAAETCTACRTYIKHLHQHENPDLDPLADDVANYGLDLLVKQDGFGKAGVNPLFIDG